MLGLQFQFFTGVLWLGTQRSCACTVSLFIHRVTSQTLLWLLALELVMCVNVCTRVSSAVNVCEHIHGHSCSIASFILYLSFDSFVYVYILSCVTPLPSPSSAEPFAVPKKTTPPPFFFSRHVPSVNLELIGSAMLSGDRDLGVSPPPPPPVLTVQESVSTHNFFLHEC